MFAVPKELITICQVLNGFPFKYNASFKENGYVNFCRTSFLWGLVVVVIQTVMSLFAVHKDFAEKELGRPIRMRSNTSAVAISLDVITLNLMCVTVFFSSVKKHRRFIEMCLILSKIDGILPQKLNNHRVTVKLLFTVSYAFALLAVSLFVESRGYIRKHGYNGFMIYYPFYTTYFAQVSLFLQFTRVCCATASRFRAVKKMVKEEVIKASLTRNIYFCLPEINLISGGQPSSHKLRTLIELYWQLCEAVHHANAFYSCQLLAAIFSSFVHIIITLYYFFLHIWPTIHLDEIPYLVMQGLWIVTHIGHLVLLVWPSTAVTEAADETAPMICKLMNRDLNPEIKKQLETFLLQLLHHNARFSALGFFQIHSHILTSMAGSVTTYLVILIQFQTTPLPNH